MGEDRQTDSLVNLLRYMKTKRNSPLARYYQCLLPTESGQGSLVGTVTGYGLDGPEIDSRWGCDFSHTSRPALGPNQPPVQWVPGLFRG
jgi:hypothetical protein